MKKSLSLILLVMVIGALSVVSCVGGGDTGSTGNGGDSQPPSVPAPYTGKTNPKEGDSAASDAGKVSYDINCATCHGDTGQGDGTIAATLDPMPQNLAKNQQTLSDDYLHWRISEGGMVDPFNSAMPAWKTSLSEDQIWEVVTYLRYLSE